jgi:hypothetical protein
MQAPLWITAPIGLGVTIVSTFAPDLIPQEYKLILYYFGWALIVFGLATGAFQLWLQRRSSGSQIDWDKWDGQEYFKWFEAACLWENLEPQLPLPRKAKERSYKLFKEVERVPIPLNGETIKQSLPHGFRMVEVESTRGPQPDWLVKRSDLRCIAERFREKPKFLYPEKRLK